MSSNLANKKCIPCEGGESPLKKEGASQYLFQLSSGWKISEESRLWKDFKFKNFKSAISFVNKVADLAESEEHHPDILIHDYKRVKIKLWTHAIGGLHENDFILAAKIDELM